MLITTNMEMPTPKYKIGDFVWYASTATEPRTHPCPDCLGKRTWHVRSPAGGVYEAPCPRCTGRHQSNSCLNLTYRAHVPSVSIFTIGSIRINTADVYPVEYMCVETGVGSGSVYDEHLLHPTKEEAEVAATILAAKNDQSVSWVKDLYNASVEFSDYELRPAVAAAEKGRVAILQYKISDMLNELETCNTMDEVRDLIKNERGE
jgi:hypothetical protein